jgi:hypothetical protein
VQFITNITLRKPHKFENSVISMVEYINSSELNTDIKAYYGDSPATTIIYPRIDSSKKILVGGCCLI